MNEGDNLIKSPLYNGYLVTVMSIFSSSRNTLRLTTLLTSLLLFGWFFYTIKNWLLPLFLTVIAGFQFHLFQFFHFSMVEMIVNGCMLVSVGCAYQYLKTGKRRSLLLSYLLIYACFLLKIQYGYLLLFPFVVWLIGAFAKSDFNFWKTLFSLTGMATLSIALFYLLWYLPFQETFQSVWAHQGTDRLAAWSDLSTVFLDSGKYLVWNEFNIWFAVGFAISLPIGIFYLFRSNDSLKGLLLISGIWALFESHKMIILYLPTRYTLSLFMAMALWMSIVITIAFSKQATSAKTPKYWIKPALGLLILLPVLFGNAINLKELFVKRSFKSQSIINQYESHDYKGQTIVGVWATSLIWNPTAHIIPVWKNFMNDDEILKKRKPPLIVTEENEADSEQVFSSRGIDLPSISDSTIQFEYGVYKINFYHLSY